jgi:hypothetical protein
MVLADKASLIPAVIHVDGTARVQTVNRAVNPRLYTLLEVFASITDVPILLNTSFNGPGEPIVETPTDALWSFVGMGIDFLILGDFLITLDRRFSSLLDLVPCFLAGNASCSLRVVDGKLATILSVHSPLSLSVSTPWGTKRQLISNRSARILRQIDGKSTGWQLLEHLRSMDLQLDHGLLARELCALRRSHIISFRTPQSVQPPAEGWRNIATVV